MEVDGAMMSSEDGWYWYSQDDGAWSVAGVDLRNRRQAIASVFWRRVKATMGVHVAMLVVGLFVSAFWLACYSLVWGVLMLRVFGLAQIVRAMLLLPLAIGRLHGWRAEDLTLCKIYGTRSNDPHHMRAHVMLYGMKRLKNWSQTSIFLGIVCAVVSLIMIPCIIFSLVGQIRDCAMSGCGAYYDADTSDLCVNAGIPMEIILVLYTIALACEALSAPCIQEDRMHYTTEGA
jgi:hypothetical protein